MPGRSSPEGRFFCHSDPMPPQKVCHAICDDLSSRDLAEEFRNGLRLELERRRVVDGKNSQRCQVGVTGEPRVLLSDPVVQLETIIGVPEDPTIRVGGLPGRTGARATVGGE